MQVSPSAKSERETHSRLRRNFLAPHWQGSNDLFRDWGRLFAVPSAVTSQLGKAPIGGQWWIKSRLLHQHRESN